MKNLSKKGSPKTVKQIAEEELGRKLAQKRDRDDFPFPSLSHRDEKNRNKKRFSLRASTEVLAKIDILTASAGITRQAWFEQIVVRRLNSDLAIKIAEEELGRPMVKRRREDLPRPELSHRDERNRIKKQFSVRATPELLKRIDEAAAQNGLTRQAWLENIIERELTKN